MKRIAEECFSITVQSDLGIFKGKKPKAQKGKSRPRKQNVSQDQIKEFIQVRKRYDELREEQRNIIIDYLEESGFDVERRGGRGIKKYKAGGMLKKPYDLSNWKWIAVYNGENWISITFQALDRDPNSKNFHALIDRIGYRAYRIGDQEDNIWKMTITDIDLPMDNAKLRKLAEIVESEIGK